MAHHLKIEYREKGIRVMQRVAEMTSAQPSARVRAAWSAGQWCLNDLDRASHPLKLAVKLLPTVSPRARTRKDQQRNLSQFFGLPSLAASASLNSGDMPSQALQLLEIGRGIMASLQVDIRSDISPLNEEYPDLAREFLDLREQLDDSTGIAYSSRYSREHSIAISKRFDKLLDTIRQLNGFEQFLRGPSNSEMTHLASLDVGLKRNCSLFLETPADNMYKPFYLQIKPTKVNRDPCPYLVQIVD